MLYLKTEIGMTKISKIVRLSYFNIKLLFLDVITPSNRLKYIINRWPATVTNKLINAEDALKALNYIIIKLLKKAINNILFAA